MDLNELRNPYVGVFDEEAAAAVDLETIAEALPKPNLRWVTLAPCEEYALRPGEVEPIREGLLALILSRKALVQVTLRGAVVEHRDFFGKRRFWHADSPICNRIGAGEPVKVVAVWNSLQTDRIHLLTREGAYLETLPAEVMPDALNDEQLKEALSEHRRVHARAAHHLRELHRGDSELALQVAKHNTEQIGQRIVGAFPNEAAAPEKRAARREAPISDLVAATERGGLEATEQIARVKRSHAVAAEHFEEARPRREMAPAAEVEWDPFDK